MELVNELVEVDFLQKLFDTASTHFDGNKVFVALIFFFEVAIIDFGNNSTLNEASKNGLFVAVAFFEFFEFLGLSFGESLNISTFSLGFLGVASGDCLAGSVGRSFEVFEALINLSLIGVDDNVGSKVNNFLNVLDGNVEKKAQCGWSTAHEPNVRNRSREADVAHTFTASNTLRDEVTFLVDSGFARANAFEFWIIRINILDWSEDTLTEQTVAFWLLRTIVNRFRL